MRDSGAAQRNLDDASRSLDSFVHSWRPAGIAHNDFYDDQMLVLPDGRIALVTLRRRDPVTQCWTSAISWRIYDGRPALGARVER